MACAPGQITEGSTPVIQLTFRDAAGDLEDPVSITAIHKKPDGSEVTYVDTDPELVAQSTGIWWLTLPAVDKGRHTIHAVGNGTSTVATATARFQAKADGVVTV